MTPATTESTTLVTLAWQALKQTLIVNKLQTLHNSY
jgi:hypothetical protein